MFKDGHGVIVQEYDHHFLPVSITGQVTGVCCKAASWCDSDVL